MSYDIVPETAPFSAEQRAWLNGFLAGMLGTLDDGQAQGGNAGSLAAAASALLPPAGLPSSTAHSASDHDAEDNFPWHEPSLTSDERMALAVGRPLPQRMMAAMAQLDCGSCGYVCKTYAAALADGSEKNLSLCSPGGSDTIKLLRKLQKESSTPPTAGNSAPLEKPSGPTHDPVAQVAVGSRARPVFAKLKSNMRLSRTGSAKDTRHIAIDLNETGLKYSVGDALGIFPTNCDQLVRQLCDAAGVVPQSFVLVDDQPIHLETILSERCLRSIPYELVERAQQRVEQRPKMNGAVAADALLVQRLQQFADSENLEQFDLCEFLVEFGPLELTAEDLIETLNPLRPRLYSIASSQAQTPHEVHLTVGRVEDQLRGRGRKGVASTMLADRLPAGAAVRVFVQPHHGFTIPPDPSAAMIMVGPGTGIAPFMAFLQQRQCDRASGKNWLFFGDQKRETDFLYQEQLSAWQTEGLLTRLDLAFSRDSVQKVYVQHRMLESGAELFRWLAAGSYFYVCGDARRMARDVEQALLEIIAQYGQLIPEAAKSYLADMKRAKRYVCDVY